MPWGRFAAGLLLVFLVQTTVLPFVAPLALDAFLAYALLIALLAPTLDARLAALIVGLAQDLGSDDALGVHAFSLGMTAILLTRLRSLVNVGVWWVRTLIGVASALPALILPILHARWWRGAVGPDWPTTLLLVLWMAFVAALLAALLTVSPRWRARFGERERFAMGRR